MTYRNNADVVNTYNYTSIVAYDKDVELIPRQPSNGCPRDNLLRVGLDTCSCEDDHCNWDLCRLREPPEECLHGTASKWEWDYLRNAWVAQVIHGEYS